jgi:hypothetical protein
MAHPGPLLPPVCEDRVEWWQRLAAECRGQEGIAGCVALSGVVPVRDNEDLVVIEEG